MTKQNITLEYWLKNSDKERRIISSKWDVYKNDGAEIIRVVCDKFKEEYAGNKYIKDIHSGVYHGGDWVIGVTIQWRGRNKIKLPKIYKGFAVQISYDGVPLVFMKKQAKEQFKIWFKEIKRNYPAMVENDEYFKNIPKSEFYKISWLMNGMSRYYNPFKK